MSTSPGSGPPARVPRITPQAIATGAACRRRLWLHHFHPGEATAPTEHQLVLRERAETHERAVATRFPGLVGPIWKRESTFQEAVAETLLRLRTGRRPLWQAAFLAPDGRRSAVPDFVWWDDDVLVVTEVRLALRPETRPDFALQLAHDRAVIRDTSGLDPGRFEIVNGYGETTIIEPAGEREYAAALEVTERTLAAGGEPEQLLAHSACRACEFYRHCWDRAERERRVEILPEVQSAHVAAYHAAGVRTLEQLAALDPARPPAGVPATMARRAIVAAAAWRDGRAVWLHDPALPRGPWVWFDLEGDSRGEDAEIPIYLWGLALDEGGAAPRGDAILAGFASGADRIAWERFQARASAILDAHPGVRWVHWDHFEPLWVKRYAERYGAQGDFVERLLAACFDLKRVLDRCVRLPLRSYSIKHIARWIGFEWRNPGSGSEWSTALYHRARTATDPLERDRLVRELAEYNEDDLLATRAIWNWMAANSGGPR